MVQTTSRTVIRKTGDTYPIEATILQDGVAYDLTGATNLKLGVISKAGLSAGTAPIDELVGTLDTDGTDGKVNFAVTAPVYNLEADTYYAEIQFTQATYITTTATFELKMQRQIVAS